MGRDIYPAVLQGDVHVSLGTWFKQPGLVRGGVPEIFNHRSQLPGESVPRGQIDQGGDRGEVRKAFISDARIKGMQKTQ